MLNRSLIDSLISPRSSDDLVREQFRILKAQIPTMYLALFINVSLLAFIAARSIGHTAFGFPIAVAAVILVRLLKWVRTSKVRQPSVDEMRFAMKITTTMAGLLALGLSFWCEHILNHGAFPEQTYIALFTSLCVICCAASIASLPLASYGVVAIGMVPISILLIFTGNVVLEVMGANLLLVSPLVIGMVFRQSQQLRRMVAAWSDIAAEKIKVGELAYRDQLTGLPNRRAFLDRLKKASAGNDSATLAIGIIDLDGFKVINDTYGHHAGDALLVETARRFQHLSSGNVLIARLGGDEFAVLLLDVDRLEDAQLRLAALATAFDQPFVVEPHRFRLSASIGLAHNALDTGTTLELVNRADLAMYEAKRQRNVGICVFKPGMEERTRRRILIEQALATHPDNDVIGLVYQPVVHAVTNRIVGFEALARWTHPTLGVISPAEFIPLAEHVGMTRGLTTHLLTQALRDASAWPDTVGLSFNLSANELSAPGLASRLRDTVAEHRFDPRRLSIEVTETALLSDFTAARDTLGALQHGGVRILLDDFGAGYASIGYLREIRFDGIKLDGSLIASLLDNPAAKTLLVGVLHLCQAIGVPVTAEMVEDEAQYTLLCMLGVQQLQGHFLARPVSAEQARALCITGFAPGPEATAVVPFERRRQSFRRT